MKHILASAILLFAVSASAQNLLPQANLDIGAELVRVGEVLHYDASGSKDSQGQTNRNLEYRFQFSKSKSWTNFGAASKGSFAVKTPGQDLIRVEIRDRVSGLTQRTFRPYLVREERRPNPPRIKLLSEPPFAAGEQVGFEVVILTESAINKNDIEVRWDFNSDGTFDTPWRTDKRGYFVYPGGNLTSPTVSVRYPGGRVLTVRGVRVDQPARGAFDYARDVQKLTINPTVVQAPIVEVSPGTQGHNQDTVFTFDASRTRLGSNSVLEFYFDGVKRYTGKTIVKHRFQSPGPHTVRVLHCINRGSECRPTEINIDIDDASVNQGVGFRPDFTAREKTPGVNQFQLNQNLYQSVVSTPILFTSYVQIQTASSRPAFEYRWDFDGDGDWDTPYNTQTSSQYTYDRAGTFNPIIEVRDDLGNTAQGTKTIIVRKNTKPIGKLRSVQWPLYVQDDIQWQLQVADAQSSPAQIEARWDFDGDGVWDSDFTRSRGQTWSYQAPGTYQVTVQLRDPQREVQTITRTVEVAEVPKPQLKIQVSHRTQGLNQPISVNANLSQGVGLQYEWKLTDDPYTPTLRGPQANFRFDTPGTKVICLHVIDQVGNIEVIEFPVTIVENLAESTQPKTEPETSSLASKSQLPTASPSDFEAAKSDFVWSDAGLIDRPLWRLTGMRPGP